MQITPRAGKRILFGTIGVIFVIAGVAIGIRFTRGSPIKWTYYTPERFADAQRKGKIILLEFTAAWCLNCHALEQAVLHNPRVVKLLNSETVIPIKVDITGNNPAGNEKLVEVGRRTIPYLVVYSPGRKQVFGSDAYTVEQITNAITKASSER